MTRNFAPDWTPEQNERLKKLWRDGFSASEIGKKMGKSRCAVLGRVNRMNLPMRVWKHGGRCRDFL